MLVGRKINWDVASEKISNDPDATKLLSRGYREPYKFPMIAHTVLQSPKAQGM